MADQGHRLTVRLVLLTAAVAAGVGAGVALAVVESLREDRPSVPERPPARVVVLGGVPRPLLSPPEAPVARSGADDADVESRPLPRSPPTAPDEAEELEANVIRPFENAPRDPVGGLRRERELVTQVEAYLGTHEAALSLEAVECRSNGCRLDLRYADVAAADRAQEDLIGRRVVEQRGCFLHSLGIEEDGETARQTLVFRCPPAF